MNRWMNEEAIKRAEARKGKTPVEVKLLDQQEGLQKRISALAKQIHLETFPEEYDFMLDDIADSNVRAQGVNPMNQEYIAMVNTRRRKMGFEPLLPDGMAPDQKTHDWSFKEAKARLGIQENS